jgi:predicted ATPase/DNA-binding winged helix-turn-helix (wHTH) protein
LAPNQAGHDLQFGPIRVTRNGQELLVEGKPIHIGGRALEILLLFINAQGALVTKDDIMRQVWPGMTVEENNLQVHVSAIRRALGQHRGLIRTVSGRGYRLAADGQADSSRPLPGDSSPGQSSADRSHLTNLPAANSELIGREAALQEVANLLAAHRIVTLVGVGGVGKTQLGFEIARRVLPDFVDGVWVAELAPLASPSLVPITVAATTPSGLERSGGEITPQRVAQALASKRLLLLLDNCEHVIDAAASLAEQVVHASPGSRVLATSREVLRAEGEWVYLVPPLEFPEQDACDPENLLRHGAVQLFIARAGATEPRFSPNPPALATIASICRRLDGIPLAIELAATRAAALGVDPLAAHLDNCFRVLTGGRRTALPRHQTLRATLDWSHGLLSEGERAVLRRVAVFVGGFTLEAAEVIAAVGELGAAEIVEGVAGLVAKSLITADLGGGAPRYRLLETTRAYALEKLRSAQEMEAIARRHAEYYRDLFNRAKVDWERRSPAEWLAACRCEIDNVRAALDWAFFQGGDRMLGVALSAVSVPLMFDMGLMGECGRRAQQALSQIDPGTEDHARSEMQLRAALAASLVYTSGPNKETIGAWADVLAIATDLNDTEQQARALWGLWNAHIYAGAPRAALPFAERFLTLAALTDNETKRLLGHRLIGIALHALGRHAEARSHIEHMLARYSRATHKWLTTGLRIDHGMMARATLARILCLGGFPDTALGETAETVAAIQANDHPMALCYVLVEAGVPLSLIVGDLAGAERYLSLLLGLSERHGYAAWAAWARLFRAALLIRSGDGSAGLALYQLAEPELSRTGFAEGVTAGLGLIAEALGGAGRIDEGLAVAEQALARVSDDGERWYIPELLRVTGELMAWQTDTTTITVPEGYLRQALNEAQKQGALLWELRAATSLARLWHRAGRSEQTPDLLKPLYERFTEGHTTNDLVAAKALLDMSEKHI